MADSVQVIMERMAVELNLLAKSGIFTKDEVRSIVRHRERFEFRVHRPQPSKLEYLRYIQYEQKLQKLRSRRLVRLNKIVNPMISNGGINHIQSIYGRALLKFPTDLSLWASYLGFCRSCGAMRAVSNALGRALCALPNEPRLWIFAANWEFKNNANVENARNIFQRAIRINPFTPELYVEYARFELLVLSKVKKLIKSGSDMELNSEKVKKEEDKEEDKEDKEDSDDDNSEGSDNDGEGKKASLNLDLLPGKKEEDGDDNNDEDASYVAGEIPRIVFAQACKKLPTDLNIRIEFSKLLYEFNIAHDSENLLRSELISDLTTNFPDSIDAHAIISDLSSSSQSPNKASYESELEEIVRRNPSKENWEKFILHKVANSPKTPSKTLTLKAAKAISSLCDEVDVMNMASERVYELWLTLAASAPLSDETLAMDVAQRAVKGCPGSPKLWRAHIALLTRSVTSSDVICSELRRAAESVEGELVKYQFWVDLVKRRIDQDGFTCEKVYSDVVVPAVNALCSVRVARSGEAGAFSPACYDIFREKFGRKGARMVTSLFLKRTPCCSVELCVRVLDAEEPLGKAAMTYLRDFYRVVLAPACLGKVAPQLWTRYHSFEQGLGNMREAANVYQRARSVLDDPSAFLDSFAGF